MTNSLPRYLAGTSREIVVYRSYMAVKCQILTSSVRRDQKRGERGGNIRILFTRWRNYGCGDSQICQSRLKS